MDTLGFSLSPLFIYLLIRNFEKVKWGLLKIIQMQKKSQNISCETFCDSPLLHYLFLIYLWVMCGRLDLRDWISNCFKEDIKGVSLVYP